MEENFCTPVKLSGRWNDIEPLLLNAAKRPKSATGITDSAAESWDGRVAEFISGKCWVAYRDLLQCISEHRTSRGSDLGSFSHHPTILPPLGPVL